MLHQAANRLPQGVKVILLADRGFIHTDAMTTITTQLGWHDRIRVKRNTWIWRVGHGWCQLKDIHLQRGEALCWHNVKLDKGEWYGPVHVAFGRNSVNGEFWAIVSDEPTALHTFEEYSLRFDIVALASRRVEAFLDDQSHGWNLRVFRFLCKPVTVQSLKRSGNRVAKCDRAAFQFWMGLVHRLAMLFMARYISLNTDSSSGKTALVLITLRRERFRDSMAWVV